MWFIIKLAFLEMYTERKHLRLKDWDYSSEGAYFITICCHDKQPCFGRICNNEIILSEIGIIASLYWLEISNHYPHFKLDEYIVMPNHIHGILLLDYSLAEPRHGVALPSPSFDIVGSCHGITLPTKPGYIKNINQFSKPVKNSVSVIINQYKSSVKGGVIKMGSVIFDGNHGFMT
jgi:putative transposase